MKVKELIKQLEHHNNPDDEVICVWWSKDDVIGWYGWKEIDTTKEQWEKLVRRFDNHDFQSDNDDIFEQLQEIREESNDEVVS